MNKFLSQMKLVYSSSNTACLLVLILKNLRILWLSPLSWNDSVEAVRCCVLKETEFFAPIHLDSIASIPGTTQASSFLATYLCST